jgi:hypothetical protein
MKSFTLFFVFCLCSSTLFSQSHKLVSPQNVSTITWSSVGSVFLDGTVMAIAVSGSDVYAGGGFTEAGGSPGTLG